MKKIITLFTLLSVVVLGGCSLSSDDYLKSPSAVDEILASNDLQIIDVRTPEEFEAGCLASAQNIDFYSADFADQISELDTNDSYLVYCRSGNRSADAVAQMKEAGFTNVIELDGGINAWTAEGYEVSTDCGPTEQTLAEIIEDFSNYESVTDENIKSFVAFCDETSELFADRVKDGEVERLYLYTGGDYGLQVYKTPNYNNWTEDDFETVNKCVELGTVQVQKIVDDYLLWSYPNCSAGMAPDEDSVAYPYFMECREVEDQLHEYLGLSS